MVKYIPPSSGDRIEGIRVLACGCRVYGYGAKRKTSKLCAKGVELEDDLRALVRDAFTLPALDVVYEKTRRENALVEHLNEGEKRALPYNPETAEVDLDRLGRPPSAGTVEPDRVVACQGCGARIVFLETSTGRKMPVDAETVARGDTRYSTRAGHRSHFGTCPKADRFSSRSRDR